MKENINLNLLENLEVVQWCYEGVTSVSLKNTESEKKLKEAKEIEKNWGNKIMSTKDGKQWTTLLCQNVVMEALILLGRKNVKKPKSEKSTLRDKKYEPDLDKAISYFDYDKGVKVASEIGKFYYSKSAWSKAIKYFEIHLKNAEEDVEIQLLLMQAYTENQQFDVLGKKADNMTQLFPTQPQFYYYAGLANNQIKNFKKAATFLESGLDFVVNDDALEINFNIQLGEAYSGLGDNKKKELYFTKANELIKKQKK